MQPRKKQGKVGQAKSEIVASLPQACLDETAATEFIERWRWNGCPCCPRCGDTNVAQMKDAEGNRSKRFLWRCHGKECRKQFTVRIGTIMEESRIPLRHWCWAFWSASASKKGISSKQVQRQTGLSYKSALFMMHRIRHAMAHSPSTDPKLTGTLEADETYVGGKVRAGQYRKDARERRKTGTSPIGRSLVQKTPVFAVVQRGGEVRTRVIANVTSENIRSALLTHSNPHRSELMTDDFKSYRPLGGPFRRHGVVRHSLYEYVRPEDPTIHTNTIEGFFSLLKRKLNGTHHAVSKRHLHLYVSEAAFLYNTRDLEDGERTAAAIRRCNGKRLYYRQPA